MIRRVTTFVLMLLVLGVGLGSVAHASEGVSGIEVTTASSIMHVDGDKDQVPSDAHKSYPHHHAGCHEHQFGISDGLVVHQITNIRNVLTIARTAPPLPPAIIDPALRPPIA